MGKDLKLLKRLFFSYKVEVVDMLPITFTSDIYIPAILEKMICPAINDIPKRRMFIRITTWENEFL